MFHEVKEAVKEICKICGEETYKCRHCQVTTDGVHVPDLLHVIQAEGVRGVVDVNCLLCFTSGSTTVNSKEISW